MYDVLLVNPSTERVSRGVFNREPPVGLLILASILRSNGYTVDLLDCSIENEPFEVIKDMASDYRIIAFTCLTNTFNLTVKLIESARQSAPNALFTLGGPHASFMPTQILNTVPGIDIICLGEYEDVITPLVDSLLHKPILELLDREDEFPLIFRPSLDQLPKGVAIRKHNSNHPKPLQNSPYPKNSPVFFSDFKNELFNTDFSIISSWFEIYNTGFPDPVDVNKIPLPARDLLTPKYQVASILVNRGCVNQCSFCSRQKLFGNIPRVRDLHSINEEIDDILLYSNYKFLNFYDNINMHPKWFREFMKLLQQKRLKIPWGCELRADTLTADDAKLMKKAGCVVAATGVESADETVLKLNFKYQDPEKVKRGIGFLKDARIGVQAYFVIGLPGETVESFNKTLDYLKGLGLNKNDEINFFIATPYPGSKLGDNPEKFGAKRILDDFDKFDCSNVILEYEQLNNETILELKRRADQTVEEIMKS